MVVGTDRYPSDPSDPMRRLEERLRLAEQKIEALTRRTLRNAVMREGSIEILDGDDNVLLELDGTGLKMYDESGALRARVGLIDSEVGYGISMFDGAGGLRFEVNDDGHRDPWIPHPMIVASAVTNVTSASFVDVYQGQVGLVTHLGVSVPVVFQSDVGTTGELRLANASAGTSTNVVAIGSGANGSATFQWLHGAPLGTGPVRFDLEARRTAGGGNVRIFQPYTLAMADPLQCTATGL